ncbi:uncharacterized protein LOC117247480 [Epinephelus lanceolatus]
MVRKCAFPNCENKMWRNRRSFHRLPYKYPDITKLWLVVLKIDENTPVHSLRLADHRVCGDHFDQDDYLPTKEGQSKLFLKRDAIPKGIPDRVELNGKQTRQHNVKVEDVKEPASERGRRKLRKLSVPVLFEWNNYSFKPERLGMCERSGGHMKGETSQEEKMDVSLREHDYALAPDCTVVDLIHSENETLRNEIHQLRRQMDDLTMRQRFGIHRFSGSDEDIRFFTRFSSYDALMRFWDLIHPLVPFMVRVTKAQTAAESVDVTESDATATNSLQPIDEMFLFLNYLALGSKLRDLAHKYGIHQSTVSWIIITWSNCLYAVLGSVRIWMSEEKIREHLPAEFKEYSDTRVILTCMELKCQCPSSPLLQSEVFSSYKSHHTLKGLIGIAPHGAVTFVSPLCPGSISDKQILRQSGIGSLLTPEMAIMVDRGFLVDDVVPCKIYKPAFLSGKDKTPASEVRETQATAHLREHVECHISKVKQHKFFDTVIPLKMFGNINQLYTVACLLTNYENGQLGQSS